MEQQVAAYGKVVARTPLIAHAVVGASRTKPSIEWFGLGKDVIVGYPCTLWVKVKGIGGVDEGRR
jgi:hypothetical protein